MKLPRRAGMAVAASVAAAMQLACGSDGGAAEAEPVATSRVEMAAHYRFSPTVIRVQAGDTVVWTNEDDFTHSVRLEATGAEPLTARPGDTVRLVLSDPGEHEYVCTLHPHDMRGTIIVEAP